MKIVVTNITKADMIVDIGGNNNIQEKLILHPKANTTQDVTPAVYKNLKSIKGLVINTAKGSK